MSKNVFVVSSQYGVTNMFARNKEFHVTLDEDKAPDLLVFTGGADVNPQLYGETSLPRTNMDSGRDKQDIEAWKKWGKVPKVGICRGGQFLNVMSGGAMWQDVNNHTRAHEMVNLLKVPGIEDDKIRVTSTHHQMMIPGKKGEEIAIALNESRTAGLATQYSSAIRRPYPKWDTEVVWYPETNSLCFQPHPEYTDAAPMTNYFFKLLDHFFFKDRK